MPNSVNPLELVWFLTGAVPLGFDLYMVWRRRRDRRTLGGDGLNGADDILITSHLGISYLISTAHTTILLMGLVTMFIPPATGVNRITATGVVITSGLFWLAAILGAVTVWDTYRDRLIRLYLKQQRMNGIH